MKRTILWFCLLLPFQPGFGRSNNSRRVSDTPLGVIGDHAHKAGELRISYRYMYMSMDGSRNGKNRVADTDVVSPGRYNFMTTPTRMPMQVHLVGLMLAVSDRITFMATLPIVSYEMQHLSRNGSRFTTNSSGVGDPKALILCRLGKFGNQTLHLQAGASIPYGSITKRDVAPASDSAGVQLSYPMQPGSGTVDIFPGITYFGQGESWSWGGQATGTLRFGKNDNDYRLGNELKTTFWAARRLSNSLSLSVRIEGATWDNIAGADPAYGLAVQLRTVPTVFADLRSGSSLTAGMGLNYHVPGSGLRLALEGLLPVHQELTGPQLERDFTIIAGTQFTF